jgi:hypothetical protein
LNDSDPTGIAPLRYGASYRAHQPDFRTLEIAGRPGNTDAGSPVLLTADCVCGHVVGWVATLQSGTWTAAGGPVHTGAAAVYLAERAVPAVNTGPAGQPAGSAARDAEILRDAIAVLHRWRGGLATTIAVVAETAAALENRTEGDT